MRTSSGGQLTRLLVRRRPSCSGSATSTMT
jgi:hypothetical protein